MRRTIRLAAFLLGLVCLAIFLFPGDLVRNVPGTYHREFTMGLHESPWLEFTETNTQDVFGSKTETSGYQIHVFSWSMAFYAVFWVCFCSVIRLLLPCQKARIDKSDLKQTND